MLIEKDLQKALHQLADGQSIQLPYDGSDITIRFIDEASKLSISTNVYYGGNYIPSSVRHSLKQPLISHPSIRTFLTVDEQNFQVNLNYLGHGTSLSYSHFRDLLEEFGMIAEKWRLYLDEHDKNDLVYVRKI
jgi:hypothetical protein